MFDIMHQHCDDSAWSWDELLLLCLLYMLASFAVFYFLRRRAWQDMEKMSIPLQVYIQRRKNAEFMRRRKLAAEGKPDGDPDPPPLCSKPYMGDL